MKRGLRVRVPLSAAALLAVTLAGVLPSPAAAQEEDPSSFVAYALVLASRLNVRSAPALDAPIRATVERGDTLCLVDRAGDWAEVLVPGTPDAGPVRGFVSRGFLAERGAGASALTNVGCTGLRSSGPRLLF